MAISVQKENTFDGPLVKRI